VPDASLGWDSDTALRVVPDASLGWAGR